MTGIPKTEIRFEPSREAKEMYLTTRKKDLVYGGFTHPGLFSTYNYGRDANLFYFAIVLEIIGLGLIVAYAQVDLTYSILIAVVALILDVIFAIWHHKPQKKLHEARIKMRLEADQSKLEILRRDIDTQERKKVVLSIPIIIMAVLKIIIFYAAYAEIDMILFAIVLSYVLVALIHIYITGFFVAEFRRRKKEARDKTLYLNRGDNNTSFEATKKSRSFNNSVPLEVHDYKKYKIEQTSTNDYSISTFGVFYDWQLQDIIKDQRNATAQSIVCREGLRHQFENVLQHQPPVYNTVIKK